MPNYRVMTTKELIRDAEHKKSHGILVPIAVELMSRLRKYENEAYDQELKTVKAELAHLENIIEAHEIGISE